MSSNNYVRMQTERAKMVSNYISSGDLWTAGIINILKLKS